MISRMCSQREEYRSVSDRMQMLARENTKICYGLLENR